MEASVSSFGKANSYILGANLVWRFCILWVPSIAKALSTGMKVDFEKNY